MVHLRHAHRHRCDSSDDICFVGIAKLANLPPRLWTRNHDQLISHEFTPATCVTAPKLDKINWSIEFVLPISSLYFVLMGVDLHK